MIKRSGGNVRSRLSRKSKLWVILKLSRDMRLGFYDILHWGAKKDFMGLETGIQILCNTLSTKENCAIQSNKTIKVPAEWGTKKSLVGGEVPIGKSTHLITNEAM